MEHEMEHLICMKRMRVGLAVAAMPLVIASCSGGSSEDDGSGARPTVDTAAQPADDEASAPVEGTSVVELDPNEVTGPIAVFANALTTEFGSAPEAGASLLGAGALGYRPEQIRAGADAGGLQTNGTIVIDGDVIEPADKPADVIAIPTGHERTTPSPDLHGIRVAQNADGPLV